MIDLKATYSPLVAPRGTPWIVAKKLLLVALFLTSFHTLQAQEMWTLEQCIAHALANNFELQQQSREIQIKQYDERMAVNERLPTIQGYSNVYSNFGHSQDVFGTIQRNDNLNSNMGITAEIMIYNYRSLKNQAYRAQIDVDKERLEKTILERELTTKVIQTYLDVLMQRALVVARDSAVAFSDKLYDRAKKTSSIGTTAQSVLYEARANLARERQQFETVQIDLQRAQLRLAQLVQVADPKQFDIAPTPSDTIIREWAIPQLNDLINRSFGVQPAIKRYALWEEDLALQKLLVRATYYPTITGSTSIGSTYFNAFRMPQTDPFFRQAKNNFAQQVAITATIPIFNKGRTRNQLRQLDVLDEQIQIRQELEKLQVRQQVEKIYLDYRTNHQNLVQAREAQLHTRLALEFAEKSYTAGQISIYELNTSRQNFIQAESELLRAKYSTIFSYKMLMYQISDSFADMKSPLITLNHSKYDKH